MKGTTIPNSFEMKAGKRKIWVAPNATKHMIEYSKKKVGTNRKLTEQQLLRSLQAAIQRRMSKKLIYKKKFILVIGN